MQLLHESVVAPEEIDSLGHMNVRYYMSRMEKANQGLIDSLGLPSETLSTSFLRRVDTYTRFRREQFEGATIHTVGGVLAITEGGMQSYVEVQNPDTGDSAATFIVTTALINRANRNPLPFPAKAALAAHQIEIPDYAQPRSLTLDPVKTDVSLEQLDESIASIDGGGMMSGKHDMLVEHEDVDDEGWLAEDAELMFLPFAKMSRQNNTTHGPPVFETADGKRVGWAVMETRNLQYAQPRLGDTIAYFSADISADEKSRRSRRWAYDRGTGRLLGISDSVGLCIDLDARRAIAWPDEIRQQIERYQRPELA